MRWGGERLPHNIHHAVFERRHYKTPLQKQLRRHDALIIETPIEWHRDLHANVPPPPELDPVEMLNLILHLNKQEYEIGTTEGLEQAVGYLLTREHYDLAGNFTDQLSFLGGEHGSL